MKLFKNARRELRGLEICLFIMFVIKDRHFVNRVRSYVSKLKTVPNHQTSGGD